MKQYQYFLFDWDGCLAQTLDLILSAYKTEFSKYGLHPSTKDITTKVFGDWNGPTKVGLSPKDLEQYTNEYLAIVNKNYASVGLYPGARDMLVALKKRGKNLAVLTTSPRALVDPALRKNELTEIFDAVFCAEDVTKHKPDPEIICKALEVLRGEKEKAIIIGDSKSDLGAARSAEIDSVLFSPPDHEIYYNQEELIEKYSPTYVIRSHAELLTLA